MYNKAVATRRPIRARKFYHLRDWTTVSHAWCPPSAQLSALTVLMVGETYKRGLLPRLPMDCWYRILNMIPRHTLRQRHSLDEFQYKLDEFQYKYGEEERED